MSVLTLGCRLGPYDITDLLGRGGMGEVYRAHDTKLNRQVALKLLNSTAANALDTERLVHEAQLMSTLSHPHIRAVYDAAEYDGIAVVVMEYVEGETLEERISRRQIPLGVAVRWAEQLASALDLAHGHRIVHHDVKPANIMVTAQGVKLLDFGIATPSNVQGAVRSSTVTDNPGIPGTTAYMAPEQLEGCSDDPRSDIFALGVVVYEMLTGRNPFEAPTRARTIATILEHEPPTLASVNAAVPPALSRAVMKCLAKDPGARWQTARDLASELAWLSQSDVLASVPHSRRGYSRAAWATAGCAALIAAVSLVVLFREIQKPQASSAPIRFLASPPPNTVLTVAAGSFAISPDGRYLAFTASEGGGPRLLWIRSLDSFEAHALGGTEDAGFPFWSPDSRTVAFFTSSDLKTVDVAGSPLQIVTKLPRPAQWGAWGKNGDILLTTSTTEPGRLYRVRASGGVPMLLFGGGSELRRLGGPEFLPDGVHFLIGVVEPEKPLEQVSIYIGTFDKPLDRFLLRADSQAVYVTPGYILYIRAGSLVAHPFDADRQQITGEPLSLPEPVAFVRAQRRASFTVSQNGLLAYRQGIPTTQLTWFDRTGRRLSTVGLPGRYLNPAIAPDDSRIAVTRLGPSVTESDIWLFEPRGERPLTSSAGLEDNPVWSPDGRRLVYSSNEGGFLDLYAKDSAASSQESGTVIFKSNHQKRPMDWTPDGKQVVFLDSAGSLNPRLPVMFEIGSKGNKPEELTLAKNPGASLRSEDQVQVSPDGHWMAYVSDASGAAQVYVRQFPDGQRRWQVSTDGGFEPKWRGDGRELFYIASDQQMMSVTVAGSLGTFEASRPLPLFRSTVLGAPFQNGVVRNEYAVTRDGQRFLINEPIDGAAAYGVRVLANWRRLLNGGVEPK